MYADMLNRQVHPVIPERGSVGEGDITVLSHIGFCMLGEGEAFIKELGCLHRRLLKRQGLRK